MCWALFRNNRMNFLTRLTAESPFFILLQDLFRETKRLAISSLLVMIVLGFLQGIGLLLLIPLLAFLGITDGSPPSGPIATLLSFFFDALGLPRQLLPVLLLYVLLVTTQAALTRWQTVLTSRLNLTFMAALRHSFYVKLTHVRWLFFTRKRLSDFTQMLMTDINQIGSMTNNLLNLGIAGITASAYLALSLYLSWSLTLLTCVCAGVLALLVKHYQKAAHQTGKRTFNYRQALYAALHEHLGGLKVIKSYGAESEHINHFSNTLTALDDEKLRYAYDHSGQSMWLSIGSVVLLSLLLYVAIEVMNLSIAALLMLIFLYARFIPRVTAIQNTLHHLTHALPTFMAFKRLQEELQAAAEPVAQGSKQPIALKHALRFNDVTFRYQPDQLTPTLANISFDVAAGQTTALVGLSGAGKSTVADMVLGLLEPESGHIYVDDLPLAGATIPSWRAHISYVPQDTFLFHDTVRANIQWTHPLATAADIREALRQAAADFVWDLPDGLDTVVGERGVRLSGGERQRIALARALLRKPTLLILDEATSALDTEHEQRIQQAIENLHGNLTILLITHRLSTVRQADHILVLEKGKLIEQGSWNTLMAQPKGRFRSMAEPFDSAPPSPIA